ncbi:HNH endonuclease [Lentzea albidocapillata]|nr:HNH endonuclease signature motif containing protein [Lentzea albidocapillata]
MAETAGRKGRPHRRIVAHLREHMPWCWLCGKPINLNLPWNDRMSFTVDHVVPLSRGGPATLDNSRSAHRSCNSSKGNRPHKPDLKTSREW